MKTHDERIAEMTFSAVYPHYLTKVEKKDRTKAELDLVIAWLTGFTEAQFRDIMEQKVTFEAFFSQATGDRYYPKYFRKDKV